VYFIRRTLRRKVRVVNPKLLNLEVVKYIMVVDLRGTHVIRSWNPEVFTLEKKGGSGIVD
jgi:hypothetical protein